MDCPLFEFQYPRILSLVPFRRILLNPIGLIWSVHLIGHFLLRRREKASSLIGRSQWCRHQNWVDDALMNDDILVLFRSYLPLLHFRLIHLK